MSTHQIEAEIERTREDLADTVDELTARLETTARHGATVAAVAAGAVAVVVVALVVWRRRK